MRLWHKDLIPYLPRQQLLGQWRECCLIAKEISENGTPNHILVNRVMDYPMDHFLKYGGMIYQEGQRRGYNFDAATFSSRFPHKLLTLINIDNEQLFSGWHNERYLKQCLYNLQEKYDCGAVTKEEWNLVEENFDF